MCIQLITKVMESSFPNKLASFIDAVESGHGAARREWMSLAYDIKTVIDRNLTTETVFF